MNLLCKMLLKGLDEVIVWCGIKIEDFFEEDIRDINDSLIFDILEFLLVDVVVNVLIMMLLKKV